MLPQPKIELAFRHGDDDLAPHQGAGISIALDSQFFARCDPCNDLAIVNVDMLCRNADGTVDKFNRYSLAEEIAAQKNHLLM